MKRIIAAIISAVLTLCASAANPERHKEKGETVQSKDSTETETGFAGEVDRLSTSRAYLMTYAGVPLIISGIAVKSEDDRFRSLRNDYLPQFNRHADDFLQYAPAAVLLGMKAFGVESRSSWGRMAVSDAFSATLMAGVVNALKLSTHVVRPDGSNDHSFPSGHTATAFMTATMLTKEYGHISPWIGIGAYTAASATGLMRMANNKHWLSDVLTGAGIGILSTELGYWFADMIFKDRGMKDFYEGETFHRLEYPSFISLYLGMNIPLSDYDIDEQNEFRTSSGSTAGVEGAYFFNPYIGAGGRFAVSNTSVILNGNNAQDKTFDSLTLCCGPYFSIPLTSRWAAGSKLVGGYLHYLPMELSGEKISAREGACFGTGLSLTFRSRKHSGVRFFLDYNILSPHSRGSAEWMSTLSCGASVTVML